MNPRITKLVATVVAILTVSGLAFSSDVAAASWQNRAYGYSLNPGTLYADQYVSVHGTTRPNAQKVRYEVRWTAPSGQSAEIDISWSLSCWNTGSYQTYRQSNSWNPIIQNGGSVGRTWNMGRDNCQMDVRAWNLASDHVPGNLKVWVKEFR